MSITLLWCEIALAVQLTVAFVTRNDGSFTSTVENKTSQLARNEFFVQSPNRQIVVEEVDKHGNSIVKVLELPDYEEGEDPQNDRKKTEQEKNQRTEKSTDIKRQDLYGCDNRRENQRKKCLQRQKKFLKTRYRSWKALIRRIIKDLDGKIKTIGRSESTRKNLNFMSGFSSKNGMRKKE